MHPSLLESDVIPISRYPECIVFKGHEKRDQSNSFYPQIDRLHLQDLNLDSPLFIGNSFSYCDYLWEIKKSGPVELFSNQYQNSNTFCIFKYNEYLHFLPLGSYTYELANYIQKSQAAIVGDKEVIQLTQKIFLEVVKLELPESDQQMNLSSYLESRIQKLTFTSDFRNQDCIEAFIAYQIWELKGQSMKRRMAVREYEFAQNKSLKVGRNFQVKEFLTADGVRPMQIQFEYVKGKGLIVSSALPNGVAAHVRLSEINPHVLRLMPRLQVVHKNIELVHTPQNSDFKSKIKFIL